MEIDQKTDVFGSYEQLWECEAPSMDATYRVLEDEWNEDQTVRTIKRIELA